jgi:prolyl-tRNA synthetase
VIIPITQKNKDNSRVMEVAKKLEAEIARTYRVELDDREGQSAGFKFNEWEVQGIPVRVEVGPRDLEQGLVTLARRDGVKTQVKLEEAVGTLPATMESFQMALYMKAADRLKSSTHIENDYAAFQKRLDTDGGFYQLHWCGNGECELKIKEETKATIRCIPFQQIREAGKCIRCGNASSGRVIIARNY